MVRLVLAFCPGFRIASAVGVILFVSATSALPAGIKVIDGDSFVTADGETIRVENIDTPSIHSPNCAAEKELAAKAVARLTELLNACPPEFDRRFTDKDGRTNARVYVCGEDLGAKLENEGLAGVRGISINWCKAE